jgi:hypothetical protein
VFVRLKKAKCVARFSCDAVSINCIEALQYSERAFALMLPGDFSPAEIERRFWLFSIIFERLNKL